MNWLKENPFVSGLLAFVVVCGGALGYFLSGAATTYQETEDAYQAAVQQLHALQKRSPFPNNENLAKVREQTELYSASVAALKTQLSALQTPLDESVTPQTFQDTLRSTVNEVVGLANAAEVVLPAGFYLGFDTYQTSLPSDKAAPALARQLAVISGIIKKLIELKVQSIDVLSRDLLPEESGATRPTPPAGNQQAAPAQKLVEAFPFDVSFTSDQGKFRVAFNSLLDSKQFLVIRSLNVENTSPAGPPVATATAPEPAAEGTTPEVSAPTVGAGGAANTLNVILGREQVKVSLRIEMIQFNFAEKEEVQK